MAMGIAMATPFAITIFIAMSMPFAMEMGMAMDILIGRAIVNYNCNANDNAN